VINTGNSHRIAIFTPSLAAGGAERISVNIANGLSEKGLEVDLIAAMPDDDFSQDVSNHVNVFHLDAKRVITSIPALSMYLRRARPKVLLSSQTHANLVAIWANMIAGGPSRVAICEHFNISRRDNISSNHREIILPWFAAKFYPRADRIISVSEGVARDLSVTANIPFEQIQVIYNPVVDLNLVEQSLAVPAHSWFGEGMLPVILGVGRLTTQKRFDILIRAFEIVLKKRDARLLILGEGEERGNLENLIKQLGLEDVVDLNGFEANPYAYMKRASVFVLSSAAEGLPTALIEAMACGVPVVSTDCPSGPSEILESGRFGRLVAVGDVQAMADTIEDILESPPDVTTARIRAMDFSIEQGVSKYYEMLMELISK